MFFIHPPVPYLPFYSVDSSLTRYFSISELATQILGFIISFVGILAIIMVILGGFWYLTAAGNEDQAKKGLRTLAYAIIGIVLISLAYVIVYSITNAIDTGF